VPAARRVRTAVRLQSETRHHHVRRGTFAGNRAGIGGESPMKLDVVDKIVNSVLYEGYMLYPYRRSSLKNQHRWNFGVVYPEGLEPSQMTTECLVHGDDPAVLTQVRFLQLYEQNSWEHAVERCITCEIGVHTFGFDDI